MSDSTNLADGGRAPRLAPAMERVSGWPWWLLVAVTLGLLIVFSIVTNQEMAGAFLFMARGIRITLGVTAMAYSLALMIGLVVGLGRVSQNRLFYNLASFYVEIVRGVPILVLLFYIAFVAVPLLISGLNGLGVDITSRDVSFILRVVLGLGIAYGAFEAEIFRAGIEAIPKGQMEAARSLGMNQFQAMRYIILPQAVRNVLPVLGNDFIAMVKDSSLVSVLGVQDITQLAKLYASSTFLFFQTYSILAFLYLVMTIMLTRVVRYIERRLSANRR